MEETGRGTRHWRYAQWESQPGIEARSGTPPRRGRAPARPVLLGWRAGTDILPMRLRGSWRRARRRRLCPHLPIRRGPGRGWEAPGAFPKMAPSEGGGLRWMLPLKKRERTRLHLWGRGRRKGSPLRCQRRGWETGGRTMARCRETGRPQPAVPPLLPPSPHRAVPHPLQYQDPPRRRSPLSPSPRRPTRRPGLARSPPRHPSRSDRDPGRDRERDRDRRYSPVLRRNRDRSRDRERVRSRDRERVRSRDRERDRSRDRERDRSRDRERVRSRDRDRDRERVRSRDRERVRSRDRERDRSRDRERVRPRDQERVRSRDQERDWSRERRPRRSRSRTPRRRSPLYR